MSEATAQNLLSNAPVQAGSVSRFSSLQGGVVWTSESIALRSQTDYRLEGSVRCSSGEAKLGVDLFNENGEVIAHAKTPRLRRAHDGQYLASEWNAARATSARVWFWVKGQAEFDDIRLAPVATSFIGNKSLDGDQRGRIPFWSEERNDTLLPGRRAGQLRLDSEMKREGRTSVQLEPTGDWMALSSVNYPVPAWTDACELSGWARCDQSAIAQLLACWTDDEQTVIRVDASSATRGEHWQLISLTPPAPPPKAMSVRIVAVARGGKVWFDDFELLRLRPRQKRLRVFVNQIGYEQAAPKSAVVAANFFPRDGKTVGFQLVTPKGKVAWKGDVPCAGRINSATSDDWGWYFWRADFSSLREPGTYRAVARLEGARGESFPFAVRHDVLLEETAQNAVDFFFIQRCGFEVPGWHKACHLDDAKLPDGMHLDLTGGWHSAGDYNKLMYEHGDGGVVFALLNAYGSALEPLRFDRDGDGWPDALDEARWGSRFVARMQIPETGALRNHVNQGPGRQWTKWAAPDVHTDNVIGTDDDPVVSPGEGNSPLVIAGWARLSVLLKERGATNDYLERAVRLWNHATKGGTNVGSPHLLISALELHRVTAQSVYLDYARRSVQSLLAQQTNSGPLRGAFGTYGDLSAAALAQFALAHPSDSLTTIIKQALAQYVTFCVGTADNPFGISKQMADGKENFFPPDVGNNFQWLSRSWAASLIFQLTGDPRALRYAVDHLDWVLGKNPLDLCMFEGKGSLNPPRYHHRYNMIPGRERGAVPGTIPNGFVRDMGLADRPGFDLSRGGNRSPSFRTSEPWLVHNLFYLLAATSLHDALGRQNLGERGR